MTFDEALAELGLDPQVAHDQASIRRAYLKGVKTRKPETDPEGFRRLRQAYDLLRGGAPAPAVERVPEPAAVERVPVPAAVERVPEPAKEAPSDPHQTLRMVLDLHRRDQVEQASQLFASVKTQLVGTGAPQIQDTSPRLALLYAVCSELDGLPELPIAFRQDAARAILGDDPAATASTTWAYAQVHGFRKTRRWWKVLRRRAPTMASLFLWNEETIGLSWRQWLAIFALPAFLMVLAYVLRCTSDGATGR